MRALQVFTTLYERDHDRLDRAAAHGAERLAAREHDAVHFRAVIALRFVVRAFERADLARVRLLREQIDSRMCDSRGRAPPSPLQADCPRGSSPGAPGTRATPARTPLSATASAPVFPAARDPLHLSARGSRSAVTFGSHGSTRWSPARRPRATCSTRPPGPRSDGRTRGRTRTAPDRCRQQPCCRGRRCRRRRRSG